MKKLFSLLLILSAIAAHAQWAPAQQQAILLRRMIERNHYSPRPVNDSFAVQVFRITIQQLDDAGFLFTQPEVDKLAQQQRSIDDELLGNGWSFLPQLTELFVRARRRADSIVEIQLQKPLDFTADDKGILSTVRRRSYPPTVAELARHWQKQFKYRMLHMAYDGAQLQTPKGTLRAVLLKNESAYRDKLRRQAQSGLRRYNTPQEQSDYVRETFLAAVAESFDPHTNYLPNSKMEAFQASLSTESKSFGFVLDDDEGKVIISNLLPGGPAWKSGELHANDQLLEVTAAGKEATDVTLLSAEDVEDLLESAEQAQFRIRKSDGRLLSVQLRKEKLANEENRVKGYVLNGSKKVGYILLPDFYTGWAGESGQGCASDVAREIINLKKEGIEGLVLDVRFNGGGSMEEALQLIGIFVDEGPLFGTRERSGKVQFLKDPNRSAIWEGPLITLINGHSASASEAFAASLQDYHRSVIVGSNSYGKATMQRLFPMDSLASEHQESRSEAGYVKVTLGKLYRLTGATWQLQGVQPDIALPDAFAFLQEGERHADNVLPSDTARRNNYYKPLPDLPLAALKAASSNRWRSEPALVKVDASLRRNEAQYRAQTIEVPLRPEAFESWRAQQALQMETANGAAEAGLQVSNHRGEQQNLQANSYAKEINDLLLQHLRQDPYLAEAYRITCDLVRLQNNPNAPL
ncbi:MAG: hypothetical protein EOO15_06175 [Chitinophagaceae bacterium]|nr:MAG: hypothetical protein EOO15_06175 [Chitinophagaceae bacterium]